MEAPALDDWLPEPDIRTRHRRVAAATPAELWEAASSVRLRETRGLGRVVRWRLGGGETVPGETTYRELFARPPFIVLDEGEQWSVSGLVGRIWTLARDYPRLADAEAFRGWEATGTAQVRARAARRWSARRGWWRTAAAPSCGCAGCGRWSARSSASSAARPWAWRPGAPPAASPRGR